MSDNNNAVKITVCSVDGSPAFITYWFGPYSEEAMIEIDAYVAESDVLEKTGYCVEEVWTFEWEEGYTDFSGGKDATPMCVSGYWCHTETEDHIETALPNSF